jgi:hypothetical protein
MDRLDTFLAATDDSSPVHVTLRGLVFHILGAVAPRLYAARQLAGLHAATLAQCERVPYHLERDDADPDRLQAGLDAWYLRHVRALPHRPPDRVLLGATLEHLDQEGHALYAWLFGELAARAGVDARRRRYERTTLAATRLHDAYYLTHLVMLDTDYFLRPVSHPDAAEWGDALAQLLPWLQEEPNPDVAGEVALCLHFLGRREAVTARALVEHVAPGPDTHEQATVLLALSAE